MYHGFSMVYDDVMRRIPYDDWFASILKVMDAAGSSRDSFLDLACGTGSMALRALESGFETWGVDISSDMLSVAAHRSGDRGFNLFLVQQDMKELNLGRRFDCVCCAFDSVNYLQDTRKLLDFLKVAREHLTDSGIFVFDVVTMVEIVELLEAPLVSEGEGWLMTLSAFCREPDRAVVEATFFIKEADGRYARFDEKHPKRLFSLQDMDTALEEAGFTDWIFVSDYSFEPVDQESPRITVAASPRLPKGFLAEKLLAK